MQLDVVCKNTTPSGQEELCTESVTVTLKEGTNEPVTTKPGMCTHRFTYTKQRVSVNVEGFVLFCFFLTNLVH